MSEDFIQSSNKYLMSIIVVILSLLRLFLNLFWLLFDLHWIGLVIVLSAVLCLLRDWGLGISSIGGLELY
jgi:hypothetical protein